jgi:hypothetical protein
MSVEWPDRPVLDTHATRCVANVYANECERVMYDEYALLVILSMLD